MVLFPQIDATGSFVRDSKLLAADLDMAALSIKSLREPLTRSVKQVIIPSIRKNFDAEGRPAWRPLADSTVERRGTSHPILNEKGTLKKRATQFNIWTIDRDSAAITGLDSRVKYAGYHQGGTSRMPQRAFIMYQDEDERAIEEIFYEFIVSRLEGFDL
jgi:phage gpG-like protein